MLKEGRTSPTDSSISASNSSPGSQALHFLHRGPKSQLLTCPRTEVTVKSAGRLLAWAESE